MLHIAMLQRCIVQHRHLMIVNVITVTQAKIFYCIIVIIHWKMAKDIEYFDRYMSFQ
jgi:hypothetical protein